MASKASGRRARQFPGRMLGWGSASALLLVPWLVGAPWTGFDYAFAAGAILLVGGAFELAVRMSRNLAYRAGVAVALATSLLLVWINGAVGIIGKEGNPANLMYFCVIGAALAGAIVARFEARGMARAMAVASACQFLVTTIALAAGLGATEPPGPIGILALNLLFVSLWAASAMLFRRAAKESP